MYILPLCALAVWVAVFNHMVYQPYALAVQVNGQTVGYVANETVFNLAREDVQQRINEYLRLSEHRRGSDYEYQVSYAWSLLPSNPAAVVGEDVDAGGSAEDDCDDR